MYIYKCTDIDIDIYGVLTEVAAELVGERVERLALVWPTEYGYRCIYICIY